MQNNSGTKAAERIGALGIVMNLFIAIPKIILGLTSSSISLFTDGVNNMMDSMTSLITYFGVRFSKKPSDVHHPYGHEKIQYITGFVISIITVVIGIEFLKKSIGMIFNPEESALDTLSRIFLSVSMVIKIFFVTLSHREYKRYGSTIFAAIRQDSITDVLISGFVLASSLFFKTYPWLDPAVALVISVFILYTGIETIKETISPLIGEAPSREDIKMIEDALTECEFIRGMHNLYIDRRSMDSVFATVDVEVEPKLTVGEVHDRLETVIHRLKSEKQIELIVHVEPDIDESDRLQIKKKIMNVSGVSGVYDIVLGDVNTITVEITANNLEHKDAILKDCREILNKESDKPWIVDTIVCFS